MNQYTKFRGIVVPLKIVAIFMALMLAPAACTSPAPTVDPTRTPFPAVTATPAPAGTPLPEVTPPAGLKEKLAAVAAEVSTERGLAAPGVEPKFLSRTELEARYKEELQDGEYLKSIGELQDILELLGVLEPGVDLAGTYDGLLSQNVQGFFDTESGEMVVVGDGQAFGGLEEMTFAHEFTHALQQARFDIHRMMEDRKDNSEAAAGLTALVEGDANLAMYNYIFKHYTLEQVVNFGAGEPRPSIEAAPSFLVDSLYFPYQEGFAFVSNLFASGGWAAVNRAYDNPPVSTSQVMHPDKYRAGIAPVPVALPDLAGALGAGWSSRRADSFGEFDLRSVLKTHILSSDASRGAAGWASDRFELLAGPSSGTAPSDRQRALVDVAVWDNDAEATGFVVAYNQLLQARGDSPQRTATSLSWTRGGHTCTLQVEGSQTLLIIAPDGDSHERLQVLFPAFR